MSSLDTNRAYRRDIDGLRGLAVAAVVLYHLNSALLPGGFVGVDVFFVISGFLITGIIVDALERGTFSLRDFYSRRIRRIFPSLLLVFAAVLALGWFALLSVEYRWLGAEVFYSSAFVANIYHLSQYGYFEPVAEYKPLLHLWSLGVEEQFYLFWPVLLALLPGRRRFSILTGLLALSFLLNVVFIAGYPERVFYLPFTRFWEIALGGVLAFQMRDGPQDSAASRGTQAWLGFGLILAAACLFGRASEFPGWRALLPTVGAYLLLRAGADARVNRVLLSHPSAVFLGLISYPLYLWHWPLLYFLRMMEAGEPSPALRGAAVLLSVLLAWLSYRFVEIPVRLRGAGGARAVPVLIGLALSCAGLSFYLSTPRGETVFPPGIYDNGAGLEHARAQGPLRTKGASWLSDTREPPIRAVIGDSHAGALYPGLLRESREGERWTLLTMTGCAPLLGGGEDTACASFAAEAAGTLITDPKIGVVLLAVASRTLAGRPAAAFDGLSDLVRAFEASGKAVAFLLDNPAVNDHPELCGPRPLSLTGRRRTHCSLPRADFVGSTREYRALIARLQAAFPRLVVYDPTDIFCDRSECPVIRDGKSLYGYSDHMSDAANSQVARAIFDRLGEVRAPASAGVPALRR